jgi:hypothetical protein
MVAIQAFVIGEKSAKEELLNEGMTAVPVSFYVFFQQLVVIPCNRSVNFIHFSSSDSIEVFAEMGQDCGHEFPCIMLSTIGKNFVILTNQFLYLLGPKRSGCIFGEVVHQLQVYSHEKRRRDLRLLYLGSQLETFMKAL